MDKHIIINKAALTKDSTIALKTLLDELVLNTTHNAIVIGVKWEEFDTQVYITISQEAGFVIGHDVLLAVFYKALKQLEVQYPGLKGNVRVCERDARDYHGWFSTTDDCIRFNVARQDQYMLRECYEAQGARGHVGFSELKRITGIRVFGEPNQARKVLKLITKETHAKANFIDLRPGSDIMNLCGSRVIVLVEATNGHFQIVNDGVPVSELEVHNAANSPYKNVDYSFLYNHPLFQ